MNAPEVPVAHAARPSTLRALSETLGHATLAVAGAALVLMAIAEGWQVFARYVLNASPSWTEPVALICMSTLMMFGAAVGVRRDAHFGFFIGVEHAPPPVRRTLRLVARLIAAGIGTLFAIWGGQLALDGWSVPLAGVPLPQGAVYVPIALGGALIALFSLEKLGR